MARRRTSHRAVRTWALAAAFAGVWLAAGAPAHAATAAQAIAALNAQRAANGIPAGIVEDPAWSEGCRLHMNYELLNGRDPGNPHDEDPTKPGYTDAGRDAARSSVLGGVWIGDDNPYESAPIHLAQLLGPGLAVTGYHDGCMFTWPGYSRPSPPAPALLSYPGDGATIYPAMVASESPYVPGDFVGLPRGTMTGPHLYVFARGSGPGTLSNASLRGPDGLVDVRTVDNGTSGPLGTLGGYLPPGGIVIPAAPLRPDVTYTAAATFTPLHGGAPSTRTWSFHTRLRVPDAALSFDGAETSYRTTSSASGTVTVVRAATGEVVQSYRVSGTSSGSASFYTPVSGLFRACLNQPATPIWAPVTVCREVTVQAIEYGAPSGIQPATQRPFVPLPLPSRTPSGPASGGTGSASARPESSARSIGLRLTLRRTRRGPRLAIDAPVAAGRLATVRVRGLRRVCGPKRVCRLKPAGRTRVSRVRLRRGTVTITLDRVPAKITANVAGFTSAGVRYAPASVTRTLG